MDAEQRLKARLGFDARRLHQRRSVTENRVGHHYIPGIDGLGGHAFREQVFGNQQRREPLAQRDAFIHRPRRTLVKHGHAVDDAFEFVDQAADLFQRFRLPRLGKQVAARLLVALAQGGEVRLHSRTVSGLGVAHRAQQQVGDLRHGRHHYGHGTLAALIHGKPRGRAHALGRADAGAAEFHH